MTRFLDTVEQIEQILAEPTIDEIEAALSAGFPDPEVPNLEEEYVPSTSELLSCVGQREHVLE